MLVHWNSSGSEWNDHEETADGRQIVKDFPFEDTSHSFVSGDVRDVPRGVDVVEVPEDEQCGQHECRALRLVADGDQNYERANIEVLQGLKMRVRWPFEQINEHEHEQNSAGELEAIFRLVLAQARHSGGQGSGFGQDEKECSDEAQVSEEEMRGPKEAVGDSLKKDNEAEDAASDVDAEPEENHGDPSELAEEVDDDEHGGQEPTAAPGDVHVLALLRPLDPHADAILEEDTDEAEPRKVICDVLATHPRIVYQSSRTYGN